MKQYLLGIDVGTTGTKAMLFSVACGAGSVLSGALFGAEEISLTLSVPKPNAEEAVCCFAFSISIWRRFSNSS